MLAQIETYQPYNARFKILKPVIEKLCQLCGIEVGFVPYGLAGHVIGGKVQCHNCNLVFHAHLSMCNDVTVYCPRCMRGHTVFTDGKTARVLVTLPVSDPLDEVSLATARILCQAQHIDRQFAELLFKSIFVTAEGQ